MCQSKVFASRFFVDRVARKPHILKATYVTNPKESIRWDTRSASMWEAPSPTWCM